MIFTSLINIFLLDVLCRFAESMAGDESWKAASSLEEEHIVPDDLVDTLDDVNDLKPNYTPVEHPTKPSLSLYYTLARLVLLSFDYKPNEDEEDTATSPETSPPSSLLHTGRTGHPQVLG